MRAPRLHPVPTLLLGLSLAGCGGVDPIGDSGGSNGSDVPPAVVAAFAASCAIGGCHDAGTRQAGLSLAAADLGSIIGAPASGSTLPLVEIGNPLGSYIAVKMLPDDILSEYNLMRSGARMPSTGMYTDPNNATILAWIAGAEFEGGGTTGDTDTDTDTGTDSDTTTDGMVTFGDEIWKILQPKCSCHTSPPNDPLNGGYSFGSMSDAAYAAIVGAPSMDVPAMNYVTAGDPANSYLLHKMKGTHLDVGGAGALMPLGSSMPIAEAQTIEDWIAAGAPQ
ncbi:MAG: hypothetical protein R3B09_08440 [Nannocystaceae bacterium]